MFDLIGGLPLHPLVVHAVVVLLPLAAVGTVAIAVVPAWRRRFGVLVALAATAATAMVPVATRSGEALVRRVGPPAGDHQLLGGELLWFALPLLVLVWALVLADARAGVAPAELRARRRGLSRGPGAAARGFRVARRTEAVGSSTGAVGSSPGAVGSATGAAGSATGAAGSATRAAGGRTGSPAARPHPALVRVLAVLAVLAALAALFQVYRVGESGARAVWGHVATGQTTVQTG